MPLQLLDLLINFVLNVEIGIVLNVRGNGLKSVDWLQCGSEFTQ